MQSAHEPKPVHSQIIKDMLAEARLFNRSDSNGHIFPTQLLYDMLIPSQGDYLPQFREAEQQSLLEAILIRLKDMTDEYQFLLELNEIVSKHKGIL